MYTEPYTLKLKPNKPKGPLAPIFGKAFHDFVDEAENEWSEKRLYYKLDYEDVTITLSGQLDHYEAEPKRIWDNKTTGEFMSWDDTLKRKVKKKLPDPEHTVQINLYAFLVREAGYEVEEACIYYVRRDGESHKTVEVELWDHEEVRQMAWDLALPLAAYKRDGTLPRKFAPTDPQYRECKWCPVFEVCARKELESLEE